jgi:hypothetical protein
MQVGPDSMIGACFDSFIMESLGGTLYTLILSQSNNEPNGQLKDGFNKTGQQTFTSSFGCSNGSFCDSTGDNRTNKWAVDILNVTSATMSPPVPEPGTLVLLASGMAVIVVLRRRKVRI